MAEQNLLRKHNTIVFLYPVQWYNLPALGKAYLDNVFERGFAFKYEKDTSAELKGKNFYVIVSTGGTKISYSKTLDKLDAANSQTAAFTGMNWKGTFTFHSDEG